MCPRDQTGPPARQRDSEALVEIAVTGEHGLLEIPATGDQVIPLRPGEFPAFTNELRFEEMGDREIDIVAAQQDMVAYCYAFDFRGSAATVRAEFE
ncbi:MAG TPA: hypothetical protein VJ349_07010 [Stellaceae bacterium]|nr:hypothetical protein [Stellaceae bacterium]